MKVRAKAGQQMPLCSFGSACTRKDCIYRHEAKKEPPSSNVCVQFIQGKCSFGSQCRNKHCGAEEAAKHLAKLRATPCRFGPTCRTADCLYLHEAPLLEARPGTLATAQGVVGVTVIKGAAVVAEPPTELRASEDDKPLPDPKLVQFPPSASLLGRASGESGFSPRPLEAVQTVRIPSDIWVADWKRNPGVFLLNPDPMERLLAVNASSPKGVLDLHYQTVDEVIPVLQTALKRRGLDWEYYDDNAKSLWVVTGAGNHTLVKGRALLFDIVLDYLRSTPYKYRVGKDNSGNAGAFLLEGLGL